MVDYIFDCFWYSYSYLAFIYYRNVLAIAHVLAKYLSKSQTSIYLAAICPFIICFIAQRLFVTTNRKLYNSQQNELISNTYCRSHNTTRMVGVRVGWAGQRKVTSPCPISRGRRSSRGWQRSTRSQFNCIADNTQCWKRQQKFNLVATDTIAAATFITQYKIVIRKERGRGILISNKIIHSLLLQLPHLSAIFLQAAAKKLCV